MMGCTGSEYSRLVKEEMASGKIYDSLLLGLKFGQKRQEFFKICWNLNRKKIVTNGEGNFVEYVLPAKNQTDANEKMTLLFFGIFNDERIMTGMNLKFYYNAWSLWNKKLHSDQLVNAVRDSLKKWYPGNDFIKVPLEKSGTELLVKVDGNRRITIRPLDDDRIVKAKIDDLRYVLDKE